MIVWSFASPEVIPVPRSSPGRWNTTYLAGTGRSKNCDTGRRTRHFHGRSANQISLRGWFLVQGEPVSSDKKERQTLFCGSSADVSSFPSPNLHCLVHQHGYGLQQRNMFLLKDGVFFRWLVAPKKKARGWGLIIPSTNQKSDVCRFNMHWATGPDKTPANCIDYMLSIVCYVCSWDCN